MWPFRRTANSEPVLPLALEHLQAGRLREAETAFKHIIKLDPGHADAHFNLGIVLQSLGKHEAAIPCFQRTLEINPTYPSAHFALGLMLQQLGRPHDAIGQYHMAITLKPDFSEAHCNLGLVLQATGQIKEAIDRFRAAIHYNSSFAAAYLNLGNALQASDKLADAWECYERALTLNPQLAEALCNQGNLLQKQGRLEDAKLHYQKALNLRPIYPRALGNLGNVFQEQDRFDEAITCYRDALAQNPRMGEFHLALGHALKAIGKDIDAAACYSTALDLNPEDAEAFWAHEFAALKSICMSAAEQDTCRQAFAISLDRLEAWFTDARASSGARVVGSQQPFHLAYHNTDNRPLLVRYGRLCHRLMQHEQASHVSRNPSPATEGKLCIGIVSKHIQDHSVWNALIKGWLLQLDRHRFELHIFSLGTYADAETALARSLATRFVDGAHGLSFWADAILDSCIDVLIYPEIGMDPLTAGLANLRLAPVQTVSWGHPETTGLPTIDYYISAEGLESNSSECYYSEKLIKLPHLGCCYHPLPTRPTTPNLASLGIATDVPLLLCTGAPFKYAAEYDTALIDIVCRLGSCQLVFFTFSKRKELSAKLEQRLIKAFADAGMNFATYGVFVPWLDRDSFHGLMQQAHVFLDTIGFSGFNTAMQAIECNLPVVAFEGPFMRGRLASSILHRIGLGELIATDLDRYCTLAVKLASDDSYRQTIVAQIERSRHCLFDDLAPVRALESFLATVTKHAST